MMKPGPPWGLFAVAIGIMVGVLGTLAMVWLGVPIK